ncbi:MAG TPA: hypothetical protein PLB89_05345 [Flavobacteriales bacterium]|nr:hypothetical protein [Flavobacteriales bacterium]
MPEILDAGGKPVSVVETDVKREHDPAELQRERVRLNNLMVTACQDFLKDMTPLPNAPEVVQVDRAKIRAYHGEKWRETARVMNASSFPHPVNEEALYEEIDHMMAEEKRQQDAATPLSRLSDLAVYDLHPFARIPAGLLHINNRVAICLSEYGNCRVYLRGKMESDERWCSGWLPAPQRDHVVDALDYTLGELMNVLSSMRIAKVTRLTDEQMLACQKPVSKNWWQTR